MENKYLSKNHTGEQCICSIKGLSFPQKFEDILKHFKSCGSFNGAFEKKVAELQPDAFVQAVRVSKYFLRADRHDFLQQIPLIDDLTIHKKVWKSIYTYEENLQKEIDGEFKTYLKNLPTDTEEAFYKSFFDVICWMECYRSENESMRDSTMEYLGKFYGLFIEKLLREERFRTLQFHGREKMVVHFVQYFGKIYPKHAEWYKSQTLFPKVMDYIRFRNDIIDLYCFDTTITPKEVHNCLFLYQTPIDFYTWKLNGARYAMNELNYNQIARNLIERQIASGELKIVGLGEEYDFNKEATIESVATYCLMDDLKVPNFIFKGKDIPHRQILDALGGISSNKTYRYENNLEKIDGKSWFEKMWYLLRKSVCEGCEILPFTIETTDEYYRMYNSFVKEGTCASKETFQTFIDIFSYTFTGNKFDEKTFHWGQTCFDVYRKPFLKFGDLLVCPTMFLGRNHWFYAFLGAVLENLKLKSPSNKELQKQCSTEMEKYVVELFKNKNNNWKVESNIKGENDKGDVDVYVESDDMILLIQLKRTQLRPTSEGAYYDYIYVDKKAARQLNDFTIQNPKNKKIVKWIVSTSYEKCMQRIDGILKINYFDLINEVLSLKYTDLWKIINHIEEDETLKNYCKIFNEFCLANNTQLSVGEKKAPNMILYLAQLRTGLPFLLPESANCHISLPFEATESYDDDLQQINKAFKLERNGKIQESIKILESMVEKCPEFDALWRRLADMYANERQYDRATKCYEKVLELTPYEPCAMYNYMVTCSEAKLFDKYNELCQQLKSKYWFMNFNIRRSPDFSI